MCKLSSTWLDADLRECRDRLEELSTSEVLLVDVLLLVFEVIVELALVLVDFRIDFLMI